MDAQLAIPFELDPAPPARDTDEDLVLRFQAGETDAFGVLYGRYVGLVRNVARCAGVAPASVDDVVQETYLVAWRRLPAFQVVGEGCAPFRAWICVTAKYCATEWRRLSRIKLTLENRGRYVSLEDLQARANAGGGTREWETEDIVDHIESADPRYTQRLPRPDELAAAWESERRCGTAIAQLQPWMAAPIVMAVYLGMAHEEIAAALQVTYPTVTTRIRRAERQLRAIILEGKAPARTWRAPRGMGELQSGGTRVHRVRNRNAERERAGMAKERRKAMREAAVSLRAEGLSLPIIAKRLEEMGYRSRAGTRIGQSSLSRLMGTSIGKLAEVARIAPQRAARRGVAPKNLARAWNAGRLAEVV